MPFEPKVRYCGTSRRERTASHPVYFNRKVPNAFSPHANIVNEFLAIYKAESVTWVNAA